MSTVAYKCVTIAYGYVRHAHGSVRLRIGSNGCLTDAHRTQRCKIHADACLCMRMHTDMADADTHVFECACLCTGCVQMSNGWVRLRTTAQGWDPGCIRMIVMHTDDE